MDKIKDFALLVGKCAEGKILKKMIFSKPRNADTAAKITGILMLVGGAPALQLEFVNARGVISHENVPALSVADRVEQLFSNYKQANAITANGDFELRLSKKGKCTIIGDYKTVLDGEGFEIELKNHNRDKNYILNGSENFLIGLGISDKNGRIHDKKRAKFRQINRFLELVRDVEDKLPRPVGIPLRICDMCCGKSYLSYAVYYYFSEIKKINVLMTGIDLKRDVVDYCNRLAEDLNFENLVFICGDVNEYQPADTEKPHMVISLHACDTATDLVLDKAAEWGAEIILSTPCCHHEMNHNIECGDLRFITEYSMLRQKLCEAATDAVRLMKLKAYGYDCEAVELIDPEDTPKNSMLRAVRVKQFDPHSAEAEKLKLEYNEAVKYLMGPDMDFGNLKGIKLL